MGERSPDMVGTGKIKHTEWTKTSTAAQQFGIEFSGLQEENLDQKSPGPSGWGLKQRASSSLITKKQKIAKRPNTKPRKVDGDRRPKLRNRTLTFGTWNVQLVQLLVCFSCVGTVIGHFYICPAGGSLLAAHYT
jgi:hypothetical protein